MPHDPVPRPPLVVGNWKMHGRLEAMTVVGEIDEAARRAPKVEVGLAVPATLLTTAWQVAGAVKIGAQDVHAADQGAHTGFLSAPMVKDAGATFTIVGHSERRAALAESDEAVNAKAASALRHGLSVIFCVGEPLAVREAGHASKFVADQVAAGLPSLTENDRLSVAYEPIWAIGSGRAASREDIAQMHMTLRLACLARLGPQAARVRLLYGGSVSADNAAAILSITDVDGLLVGGASLKTDTFAPIIAAAGDYGAPSIANLLAT